MIDTPHYVRFTRALAVAATLALPACSTETSAPDQADASSTGATEPAKPRCRVDAASPADDDAGAPVADAAPAVDSSGEPDAGGSPAGPLAPPELPASFA